MQEPTQTLFDTQTPEINDIDLLIGEGRKYANQEEALKGLVHSQAHIAKLEAEAKEREQELAKAKTLQEVADLLKTQQTPPTSPIIPPVSPEPQTVPPVQPDVVDIKEQVNQLLAERSAESKRQANREETQKLLISRYGTPEVAQQAIQAKAEELNVSESFLTSVGLEQSPKALMELLGASTPKGKQTAVTPATINPSTFEQTSPNSPALPGTYKYYEEIRKSDPRKYKRMYPQMMQDLLNDRDKFYS